MSNTHTFIHMYIYLHSTVSYFTFLSWLYNISFNIQFSHPFKSFTTLKGCLSLNFSKFLCEIQSEFSKYLNSFLSSVLTTAPHHQRHATQATPASGWQSSGDVVDAIVLSLRWDNPTKSLTHAICLNLSAKLSAALHRRSAPSYVCAGLSIRKADEQARSCSAQVPNEVPREEL